MSLIAHLLAILVSRLNCASYLLLSRVSSAFGMAAFCHEWMLARREFMPEVDLETRGHLVSGRLKMNIYSAGLNGLVAAHRVVPAEPCRIWAVVGTPSGTGAGRFCHCGEQSRRGEFTAPCGIQFTPRGASWSITELRRASLDPSYAGSLAAAYGCLSVCWRFIPLLFYIIVLHTLARV